MENQNQGVTAEALARTNVINRDDFEQLVRLHGRDLQRFVNGKVAKPEDAADISQTVLLRAYLNLETFQGRAAPITWLIAIARRVVADFYRANRNSMKCSWNYSAFEDHDDLSPCDGGSMHEMCDTRQRIEGCVACLLKVLPLDEQLAIILCDIHGFSDAESSRLLGAQLGTLKHLLHRGRATMDLVSGSACALVRKSGTPSGCAAPNAVGHDAGVATSRMATPSSKAKTEDCRIQELLSLRTALLRDIDSLLHSCV